MSNPQYRLNRLSASPPLQQAVSKRDKKRMAMTDRLAELSNNFAENRDFYYRDRLRSFHADIAYISNAQLYDNKYLDDAGVDTLDKFHANVAANTQGSLRAAQQAQLNGNGRLQIPAVLGRHAAAFVQEVNDALEQKDVDLVTATVSPKSLTYFKVIFTYTLLRTSINTTSLLTNFKEITCTLFLWRKKNTSALWMPYVNA